jgi:hypothetical protein
MRAPAAAPPVSASLGPKLERPNPWKIAGRNNVAFRSGRLFATVLLALGAPVGEPARADAPINIP